MNEPSSREEGAVEIDGKRVFELPEDHGLRPRVARELAGFGLTPEFMGPPGIVLVSLEGEELEGFCVLHDMKTPAHHPGTAFDMEAARELLALPGVGLFRIALVHSPLGSDHLAEVTERLLRASDRILGRRFDRHALVIPLMREANRLAFPLWEELGFKQRGLSSFHLELDLEIYRGRELPLDLSDTLDVVFMDEVESWPVPELVERYSGIFLGPGEVETGEEVIAGILNARGFAPELSLLIRRRADNELVGFLLAEREGPPEGVNVTVAGLIETVRSRGLPMYCYPLFVRRCLERGITSATQMTSRQKVVRLLCDHLGARVSDELVWLIRAR